MPDKEILDELEQIENETLQIQLIASAERAAITIDEYVDLRLLGGATREMIKAELLEDLRTGGRIFGELKNSLKATAHGNTRRVSDIGTYSEKGVAIKYTWVTVEDPKRCPDCKSQHLRSLTWKQWEAEGRFPRNGWSICRRNCRCFLMASDAPGFPETPIFRERRRKK